MDDKEGENGGRVGWEMEGREGRNGRGGEKWEGRGELLPKNPLGFFG